MYPLTILDTPFVQVYRIWKEGYGEPPTRHIVVRINLPMMDLAGTWKRSHFLTHRGRWSLYYSRWERHE
jgi:hypothetical protein